MICFRKCNIPLLQYPHLALTLLLTMPYMLLRLIFGIALFLVTNVGQAQSFRNEWIKYGLTYFKFKIGQLVRVVRTAELGPLRLGRTVSLFEWDGSDQGGRPLANGVYTCRVIAPANSEVTSLYKKVGGGLLIAEGKVYLQR